MKLKKKDLPQTDGEWKYNGAWHSKLNGRMHNSLGPAIVYDDDGGKAWLVNGKLHRLDGAAVEYDNGQKEWWVDGKIHRLDGPAVEYSNGQKEWWVDGKIHRLDGPAVEYSNGQKEWYVNDVHLRKKDFSSAVISFLLGVDREIAKLLEQEIKR